MAEETFIVRGGAKISIVSKEEVCRCVDGSGALYYDFRTRKFVFEGKCKLMLLCTMIEMQKFKSKLEKQNFLSIIEQF